ncbi:MAG: alpha/beta hydrolase [Syntrophorhabdales bacterium]
MNERITLALLVLLIPSDALAQQLDPVTKWAATASYELHLSPNIVYQRAGSVDLTLDVIAGGHSVRPVLIYFHGGGWVLGNKDDALLKGLPYLARGMDFVDVEYRLAYQSLAPAAVEDCRCALHWVAHHAEEYGFDTSKIVLAGESAGGHLALMTGMLNVTAGFDRECEQPSDQWGAGSIAEVKVAAIIDLFGVTDVAEFLQPPTLRNHAVRWLGDLPNRMELAEQLSPLSYVRRDLPPILIIHGDKDQIVPYQQAVRLHEALESVGSQNQFTTIVGGGHGSTPPFAWTSEQNLQAQEAAFNFLEKFGILQHRGLMIQQKSQVDDAK